MFRSFFFEGVLDKCTLLLKKDGADTIHVGHYCQDHDVREASLNRYSYQWLLGAFFPRHGRPARRADICPRYNTKLVQMHVQVLSSEIFGVKLKIKAHHILCFLRLSPNGRRGALLPVSFTRTFRPPPRRALRHHCKNRATQICTETARCLRHPALPLPAAATAIERSQRTRAF